MRKKNNELLDKKNSVEENLKQLKEGWFGDFGDFGFAQNIKMGKNGT